MITDMLGRDVVVGDLIVSHNNIYKVLSCNARGTAKCILENPSKTSRPKIIYCNDMFLIDSQDALMWILKGK